MPPVAHYTQSCKVASVSRPQISPEIGALQLAVRGARQTLDDDIVLGPLIGGERRGGKSGKVRREITSRLILWDDESRDNGDAIADGNLGDGCFRNGGVLRKLLLDLVWGDAKTARVHEFVAAAEMSSHTPHRP